jgi:hypothetical protein
MPNVSTAAATRRRRQQRSCLIGNSPLWLKLAMAVRSGTGSHI